MNSEQRRDRLNSIGRRGIPIPQHAIADLDRDTPSPETRAWSWWSAVWSRPTAATWTGYEKTLANAQEQCDASERHVDAMQQLADERKARETAAQAERDAAYQASQQAELEAVIADLKRTYLSQPGTTPEGYEAALPEMLEQRARAATLATSGAIESPLSTQDILSA
jgi:multidrug efflux pump subunit AcrA (membrane-fusion protein)